MLIKLNHLKDLRAFLKLTDIKWCFISTRNTSASVINFLKASLTVQLIIFSGTKTIELSHKKKISDNSGRILQPNKKLKKVALHGIM